MSAVAHTGTSTLPTLAPSPATTSAPFGSSTATDTVTLLQHQRQQHQTEGANTTSKENDGVAAEVLDGGLAILSQLATKTAATEQKNLGCIGRGGGNSDGKNISNKGRGRTSAAKKKGKASPPPPPRHHPKVVADSLEVLASLSATAKAGTTHSATAENGRDGAAGATVTAQQAAEHTALLAQQQAALQQLLAQQASMMQQASMVQQQQQQQQQTTLLQQHALSSHLPTQTIQQQQQQMAFMPYAGFAPSPFQGGVGTATNSGITHLMQTPQGAVGYSPAPFQGGALAMPGASNGFASMPSALASTPQAQQGRSAVQAIGMFNNSVNANMKVAQQMQQIQMQQMQQAQVAATTAAHGTK
jgi:hypothetical protein